MRTFASESVRKSLIGVSSDDIEVIPHSFDHFAAKGVSKVIQMCFFCKMPSAESPAPPLGRGSPSGQTGPSRLLEIAMGL